MKIKSLWGILGVFALLLGACVSSVDPENSSNTPLAAAGTSDNGPGVTAVTSNPANSKVQNQGQFSYLVSGSKNYRGYYKLTATYRDRDGNPADSSINLPDDYTNLSVGPVTDKNGNKCIIITYDSDNQSYEKKVTIGGVVSESGLLGIMMVRKPNNLWCYYGQALSEKAEINALSVLALYDDGSKTVIPNDKLSFGYDSKKLGDQKVTVSYGSFDAGETFNVTVKPIGTALM